MQLTLGFRGEPGYTKRLCKHCMVPIDGKHPNAMYCSSTCKRTSPEYRAKQSKWRKTNRETLRVKKAAYVRANSKRLSKQAAAWRAKHPRYSKDYMLRWYHGITLEDKEAMYAAQGRRCPICDRELPIEKLFVDHDHKTNKVRGLLCHHHNAGLGHFHENEAEFLRAIQYILAHSPNGVIQ